MTYSLRLDGGDLPSTHGVPGPRTAVLRAGRPVAHALLRAYYRLEVHGTDNVPTTGPVVMAANHVGWLDGPLLAISSPRPVFALTKLEMFEGALGKLLTAAGQIPLDRFQVDVAAIRRAVRALRDGHAVGVFPEGTRGAGDMSSPRAGAAYLAIVTGAPVVPVSFLGTRIPGGWESSVPPRNSRVAMTFGEPIRLESRPWPRTQQQIADAAAVVTDGVLQTMRLAEERTGLTLPGPLGPRPEKKQ
ncbi:MAG TPA: lysophospholipid acyltransferase family protein [Marmoricola sp.]|nr:lysophospholipid acyltransferase family protein [Marmoricola sp.]